MKYYNRQGELMSFDVAVKAMEGGNKRVLETTLRDGAWVSTVWLGLDHNMSDVGPPLIFETMLFATCGEWSDLDQDRYSTEAEAIEGHWRMVKKHGGEVDGP